MVVTTVRIACWAVDGKVRVRGGWGASWISQQGEFFGDQGSDGDSNNLVPSVWSCCQLYAGTSSTVCHCPSSHHSSCHLRRGGKCPALSDRRNRSVGVQGGVEPTPSGFWIGSDIRVRTAPRLKAVDVVYSEILHLFHCRTSAFIAVFAQIHMDNQCINIV